MRKWRYELSVQYKYQHPLLANIEFKNDDCEIANGIITIYKGYRWDGCSPNWRLPLIGWVGTPDGGLTEDGRPRTFYASLVHDVLCQYRDQIYIDKESTIKLFQSLLRGGDYANWKVKLYGMVVRVLGPQDWLGYKK